MNFTNLVEVIHVIILVSDVTNSVVSLSVISSLWSLRMAISRNMSDL